MSKRRCIPLFVLVFLLLGCSKLFAAELDFQQRSQCVTQFCEKMGLPDRIKIDSTLMEDILTQDMMLSNIPEVNIIVNESLSKDDFLDPTINRIKKAIINHHPAICEFLFEAMQTNIIPPTNQKMLIRMMHYTYLLELIVSNMAKNPHFMTKIHQHFIEKRRDLGMRDDLLRSSIDILKAGGGLFGAVKAKTIDGVMKMYVDIQNSGEISPTQVKSRKRGLKLNILEAYTTDRINGFYHNAVTGLALAYNSPNDIIFDPKQDNVIRYLYDQDWTSLYETWNLAFIVGNLDNLHLVMPKLLIPSVIDAQPNDYIYHRVLALWFSINMTLFKKLEHVPDVKLPNGKELSDLWGQINYKYAKEYLEGRHNWKSYLISKKLWMDRIIKAALERSGRTLPE